MKNTENINVGQVAYYSSPDLNSELLKIKVLNLESLYASKEKNGYAINKSLFLVKVLDVIIPPESTSLKAKTEDSEFLVTREYLFNNKSDAIKSTLDKIKKRLEAVNQQLAQKEVLSAFLNNIEIENKAVFKAKSRNETIHGVRFNIVEDLNKDYYTFSPYLINSIWDEDFINNELGTKEPIIFKAYITEFVSSRADMNGLHYMLEPFVNYDNDKNDLRYILEVKEGYNLDATLLNNYHYRYGITIGKDHLYEDYNSAMIGLKFYVEWLVKSTKEKIKSIEAKTELLEQLQGN